MALLVARGRSSSCSIKIVLLTDLASHLFEIDAESAAVAPRAANRCPREHTFEGDKVELVSEIPDVELTG